MLGKKERVLKKAVVIYFKTESQNLLGETD
jgi:hypothetical protein